MSYIVYFAWADFIACDTSDMLDKPTSMSLQNGHLNVSSVRKKKTSTNISANLNEDFYDEK